MNRERFATLVFQGKRFQGAMPLQALGELAAYQELVLTVAKGLFTADHPTRRRLPRGFSDSFRLVLDRVEEGSAVPVLLRERPSVAEGLTESLGFDYFERARILIEQSVLAAANDDTLPEEMPADAIAKFNSFGRTLGADEAIVIASPSSREGAVYTKAVRRKLLVRLRGEYEEAVSLVGFVVSVEKDPIPEFTLRTLDTFQRVTVRVPTAFFQQALRAVADDTPVMLSGTGLFDATGKLTRVTEISDLTFHEDEPSERPGCGIPIDEQMRSLAMLQPGWFDGDGAGFEPSELAWAARLFTGVIESFELPNPYVYPTPEGAVRAEWSGDPFEMAVILDTKGRRSEVFATAIASGEVHELAFALTEAGAESKMGRYLAQHFHSRAT